ncbi:hypothetical protein A0J61_07924 [Choanephora cucurbitarum]|uniref:Uncharacterized protein n=1 Tax=Choanephora cucurbitarum TaxID=101091 RepID=A0A1C7N4J0_9FUNG|nr:hypothetical protein A0J61_07924 [Choanephora cucurbitarum]
MLGKLLCEWDPRSRYQYGELILPVILSGTLNELPTVQTTCKNSLSKVGLSCTQDLVGAGVLDAFPADEKEAEKIGLQHLVHMCYDKSAVYLIEQSTSFVQIRQETGLRSLKLLLEYATVDDLVRSIRKLMQCLLRVFATAENQTDIQEQVYAILMLLIDRLPSPEICLEALTLKLDRKRLVNEADGLPSDMTVRTVILFLERILTLINLSESETKRILSIVEKPYLKDYMNAETIEKKQQLVYSLHKA